MSTTNQLSKCQINLLSEQINFEVSEFNEISNEMITHISYVLPWIIQPKAKFAFLQITGDILRHKIEVFFFALIAIFFL